MKELTDIDRMPFGKHRGEPMQDVPAQYFNFLWHNGLRFNQVSEVADYIRRNIDAFKKENPDLIWS